MMVMSTERSSTEKYDVVYTPTCVEWTDSFSINQLITSLPFLREKMYGKIAWRIAYIIINV